MLRSLVPNLISSYFTPNIYAFNLSFSGSMFNYAAAIAILSGIITMIIAFFAQNPDGAFKWLRTKSKRVVELEETA